MGYVTVVWNSPYLGFHSRKIPEISDLNVLPNFRRKGIGTRLVHQCEKLAEGKGFKEIGLGVGLISDYGSAQRLYLRLGYMPDGQGAHYKNKVVKYNQDVRADDDLVIFLSKKI